MATHRNSEPGPAATDLRLDELYWQLKSIGGSTAQAQFLAEVEARSAKVAAELRRMLAAEGKAAGFMNICERIPKPSVSHLLVEIQSGNQRASEVLLPLVYDELRRLAAARMASERPDHTLSATALVHEAYVRLVDTDHDQHWDSRGHFFAAAAEAMRRILVDSAKQRSRKKRGGELQRVSVADLDLAATVASEPDVLLDVDACLDELAEEDHEAAELAKLRLYAGLSVTEAGELLGMSRATAYNAWRFVRSWFAVQLAD